MPGPGGGAWSRGVCSGGGCAWSGGEGGVPGLGGGVGWCAWSRGGVPGLGGLLQGGGNPSMH